MLKISGKIGKGEGIGRTISFPTINIVTDRNLEIEGVYACRVLIDGREWLGAGYVGEKVSLPQDKFICEVFLFENCGNVYGKVADVELLKKIRDLVAAKNLDELKILIEKDVRLAKEYFKHLF